MLAAAAQVGFTCLSEDSAQCLCQQSSSSTQCYLFDLASGDDCGGILDEYSSLLTACVYLGVANCALALVLAVLTSRSVCRCTTAAPAAPHEQQQQPPPQQQPPHEGAMVTLRPTVVETFEYNTEHQPSPSAPLYTSEEDEAAVAAVPAAVAMPAATQGEQAHYNASLPFAAAAAEQIEIEMMTPRGARPYATSGEYAHVPAIDRI